MKTIDNYILERLNPRHLGSVVRFPIDGTVKEIIKFLKINEFKEIKIEPGLKACKLLNSKHAKVFAVDDNPDRIWFADTERDNISDETPAFLIKWEDSDIRWLIISTGSGNNATFRSNLSEYEFMEKLNKQFGWK